jgi:tetratricopeptide (TPR) repeat protein
MLSAVFLASSGAWGQQDSDHWQQFVHERVRLHELNAALSIVDQHLQLDAADLEAHGWRGRLLAWQGQWSSAEAEFRLVLDKAPNDIEILGGLADVLLWQEKLAEALDTIDRARTLAPTDPEVLLRRARILRALRKTSEARSQYRELLASHPENQPAKAAAAELRDATRHEFRLGYDGSAFNYTGPAQNGALFLTSRWTSRFTTAFSTSIQQRFGERAVNFTSSGSFRTTKHGALTLGGTVANHQAIIAQHEAFFEYGHGLPFSNPFVKGLELSYKQRWLWYDGGHVLTLSFTQLYYLPKEWTWTFSLTGARSGLAGSGIEWVPSGYTRLGFPIYRKLSGHATFANGAENFAQIDQLGHFSAHTYAGGLKLRFVPGQDITGYVGVQNRTDGRTQQMFGMSYGYRF